MGDPGRYFAGRSDGESAWSDVAAARNREKTDAYRPSTLWGTPTRETSQWARRPEYDEAEAQKHYDEFELDHAAYTHRSVFGGTVKRDARGREVNNPGKKRWWQGLF